MTGTVKEFFSLRFSLKRLYSKQLKPLFLHQFRFVIGDDLAGAKRFFDKVNIQGIRIDNLTMLQAIENIINRLDSRKQHQICFVNADCVNIACRDKDYQNILCKSDLVLADGIGMKLAGKILTREIKQNVNGTDMFPFLCQALSGSNKGLFLLGGRPGISEKVKHWIKNNYTGVNVSGYHHGYFSSVEESSVIEKIKDSGADLILVAFGAPHQEKWINRNLLKTGAKVAIGVGGLFDFYSGRIPRAPLWMRKIGMEWAYRFYQEPKRMWKRYLWGNSVFLLRVLKEKLLSKQKKLTL